MSLLSLGLIAAFLATLLVQTGLERSPFEQMFWWLIITLGLTLVGWVLGLAAIAP